MIESLTMDDMAIDMGTAHSRFYLRNKGLIYVGRDEGEEVPYIRSYVSRKRNHPDMIEAVGEDAYNMLGRSSILGETEVKRSVRKGRVDDPEAFRAIVEYLVKTQYPEMWMRKLAVANRPRAIIGVPCNSTSTERRAIREIIKLSLRAKPILVWEPIAAAIGAGLPFQGASTQTIVDIGGGTTDISFLSSSKVSCEPYSFEVGGDLMDETIIKHVAEHHGVMISVRAAEWIKKKIGTALPYEYRKLSATVKGRPFKGLTAREAVLDSEEICQCLQPVFRQIADSITEKIDDIQDEEVDQVPGDIQENGIHLTGGGSLINDLDKLLEQLTGFKIHQVESPLLSVIMGCGHLLNDDRLLEIATCQERQLAE